MPGRDHDTSRRKPTRPRSQFGAASANDPRDHERRQLLDTYRTFGCEDGTPTFRYSLIHLSLLFAALLVDHYLP